jgi:hydrogenase maturation protease
LWIELSAEYDGCMETDKTRTGARCLILACGNTLRSDDGVGPWLASWAEERFADEPRVRVISRQQWTPDLAEEIAAAESVVFVDCSVEAEPGSVQLRPVEAAAARPGLATHHVGAPELLALANELYSAVPERAWLLTIGAASIELGEELSSTVKSALPEAQAALEKAVRRRRATTRSA